MSITDRLTGKIALGLVAITAGSLAMDSSKDAYDTFFHKPKATIESNLAYADASPISNIEWKYAKVGAPIPNEEDLTKAGYICRKSTTDDTILEKEKFKSTVKTYTDINENYGLSLFIPIRNSDNKTGRPYGFQEFKIKDENGNKIQSQRPSVFAFSNSPDMITVLVYGIGKKLPPTDLAPFFK